MLQYLWDPCHCILCCICNLEACNAVITMALPLPPSLSLCPFFYLLSCLSIYWYILLSLYICIYIYMYTAVMFAPSSQVHHSPLETRQRLLDMVDLLPSRLSKIIHCLLYITLYTKGLFLCIKSKPSHKCRPTFKFSQCASKGRGVFGFKECITVLPTPLNMRK